ncbi:Retrotransposon protein [Gossypium australe]|uniref:Retrotransposon protein n=1 Tax=Gossypium australe TaxID=47621 RepID=A0A5B6X681_9ROSI|nr:Retrotransposon protein [Gossypium australe]
MQEGKLIAYASKQLKPHERNYPIHDLELARHYLFGEKCHIFTDHKSLKYLMLQKDFNLRQHKWLELLKDYDLVIDYHSRKANVVADALNRKSFFVLRVMNTWLSLSDEGSIVAELKAKPTFLQQIYEAQKNYDELQAKQFNIGSDDYLLFKDRICISKNSEMEQKILYEAHNGIMFVHPGSNKMYNDLKKMYWWPGMKRDISEFVSRCLLKLNTRCLQDYYSQIRYRNGNGKELLWTLCQDYPYLRKKKDDKIINRLTNSANFISVHLDFSLDKLAYLYVFEIVKLHGVPVSIISDRDPRFTSRI